MELDARITRLERATFPAGILSTTDGRISVIPGPADPTDAVPAPGVSIVQGGSLDFTVLGMGTGGRIVVFSDREDIAMFAVTGPSTFTISAVYVGISPDGRAIITVQIWSADGQVTSLTFPVDVVHA